jgi:hypothetical protein
MRGCSNGCIARSKSLTLEEKLSNYIPDSASGCHIWQGTISDLGGPRAIIWFKGKLSITVRVMWERFRGPIPDGLCCCHHCDNPMCVNLDHIFLGTRKENSEDMARKGRSPITRGSKSGKAILTEAKVLEIVKDPRIPRLIAEEYGVGKSTIDGIKRGRRWQWLTGLTPEMARR